MLCEERLRLLWELLGRLPPEEREAGYYCCVLGLKPSAAAELLGRSTRAVSVRLYRGRQRMRKMWPQIW